MSVTVVVVLAAVALAAWLIHLRTPQRASEDEQLASLIAGEIDSPLLREMVGLRGDLRKERTKHLRDRLVFLVVVSALLLLWNGQRTTTDQVRGTNDGLRAALDQIVQQREASRRGLCLALDDMRQKHNHLVNTNIGERQALIDSINNGTSTAEQKAQGVAFFQAQIADYQQDITEIVDCNNPDALASLFTPPGG